MEDTMEPKKNDTSALYELPPEKKVEVMGVTITLSPITGVEFLRVQKECADVSTMRVDTEKLALALINLCVKDPELDIDKLSPEALLSLYTEIDGYLGVTTGIAKKLLRK